MSSVPSALSPRTKPKPSGKWYWLAVGILLLTIILTVIAGLRAADGFGEVQEAVSMDECRTPGQTDVHLDEPGTYALYERTDMGQQVIPGEIGHRCRSRSQHPLADVYFREYEQQWRVVSQLGPAPSTG
ncbi:MAG: hypothetical protein ACLFVU_00070 [Phycisphaerae bacterium]